VRQYLRPGFAVPYGIALAVFAVAVIFFGWAGFWLGVAVLVLVRVARWGVPLIRLSYQEPRDQEPSHQEMAPPAAEEPTSESERRR